MDKKQLKQLWGKPGQQKRVRRYNTSNFRPVGKIVIDKDTHVQYDYSDFSHPKSKLVENSPTPLPKMPLSTTPSDYPIFRGFLSGLPSENHWPVNLLQAGDFFYLQDLDQLCYWSGEHFQLLIG